MKECCKKCVCRNKGKDNLCHDDNCDCHQEQPQQCRYCLKKPCNGSSLSCENRPENWEVRFEDLAEKMGWRQQEQVKELIRTLMAEKDAEIEEAREEMRIEIEREFVDQVLKTEVRPFDKQWCIAHLRDVMHRFVTKNPLS